MGNEIPWYKDITVILQLIPLAIELIDRIIKMIQSNLPSATGAAKKEIAMKYMAKVLPTFPPDLASSMIDGAVGLYKATATEGFKPDLDKGK